uniref:Uncharacterized protein n=1 Tax=Zea mays TaxID=4577 RepID=B6TQD4_MAIZE|nr:hypothetical protein [Zea mays]ACG41214.1 hypothetical protein [Zea mays]
MSPCCCVMLLSWSDCVSILCFHVLFTRIMSGLTLGLMSLSLVELEILQCSSKSISGDH